MLIEFIVEVMKVGKLKCVNLDVVVVYLYVLYEVECVELCFFGVFVDISCVCIFEIIVCVVVVFMVVYGIFKFGIKVK